MMLPSMLTDDVAATAGCCLMSAGWGLRGEAEVYTEVVWAVYCSLAGPFVVRWVGGNGEAVSIGINVN